MNMFHDKDEVISYKSFIAERAQQNPHLQSLHEFLSKDTTNPKPCHMICLELSTGNNVPKRRRLDREGLKSLLGDQTKEGDVYGRFLIVEDVSNAVADTLGSLLNIDPFFFALHMNTSEIDIRKTRIQTAVLPSTRRRHNFLNLHYHRVVEFENLRSEQTVFRDMNILRKVKILSRLKGIHVGLARHCCSILSTQTKDGTWLGLVLVDPPISNSYILDSNILTLQTRLFQGGFLDFSSTPTFSDNLDSKLGPVRSSPLETIVFYLVTQQLQHYDKNNPTLLSLSYYPLKIVAAEWMVYLELMYHNIKQYEIPGDSVITSTENITSLSADIYDLQQWARRSIATAHKIRHVIEFLGYRTDKDRNTDFNAAIREDYEQIAFSVDIYSRRLEAMVTVATSLVQAIDTRQSLSETVNLSKLSYVALNFIPLTFVSGIFSMNDNIAPGGKIFGLYFAVSIPLYILVFLISRPRTTSSGFFGAGVWRLKAIQGSSV